MFTQQPVSVPPAFAAVSVCTAFVSPTLPSQKMLAGPLANAPTDRTGSALSADSQMRPLPVVMLAMQARELVCRKYTSPGDCLGFPGSY